MAIWEVRCVMSTGSRSWENVWHVDVGAATDVAPALVDAFVTFSRDTLLSIYQVTRVVRRPVGVGNAFTETIVNAPGTRGIGSHNALPLFNVVRVLLEGGAGRPGIKLLRGLLVTVDIIDELSTIDGSIIGLVNAALIALMNQASDSTMPIVYGGDDRVAVTAVPDGKVEMRQLHRKRRRAAP